MKNDFQHESKQRKQLSYKYSLLEKQSQAATNTELMQNSDRKKELMDLNHKVEELMKDKEMLHAQNQSLCRSLITKDEELHHIADEKRQLLQQVKGTDSMKVSDLQRKLTKVKRESMMSKNKDLQGQLKDLTSRCQKTADENVVLRSKTERGSTAERELSSLKQEIKKLQKQQSTVTLERDSLKSEKEKLSGLLENQRHQNQLHGKKILELNDAIERLDRDNKELHHQNQQLMLKQDSQRQGYQKNSAAAAKENERLQREITDLRNQIKDSELTVKSTLDRVQVIEGEKAQLKAEIQRQANQIQDLKIRHDTYRQGYQRVSAAAKEEKEKFKREITDLKKQRADSVVISKSVAEKVQTDEREKTKLEADIQRYKDQIQELNTQNIQQVRREKQLKTDLDTQSKNYLEAQKELSEVKTELYGVKQQMEKEISSLQSQIERQESYEQMYQQMSAAEEEKEKLQREITDLKKYIADLEAEVRRYKDQKQELTKRCEEVEQVWHYVRHTPKQNEEIMEKCSSRIHEHDETVHALKMQSEETEKERDKPQEEQDETIPRHAQAVMDISPREMAMRLEEVYRKIDEMIKRDKAQTDKKDADEEDLSILSDLKELLQKYYTLMEKRWKENKKVDTIVLDQEFLEVLPAVRNKFQMFSQSFLEICHDMFRLAPPPRLEFGDEMKGSTINRKLFNCYKKPEVVDYVIWPALVSRFDDIVYEKGIVKPQLLTK